MTNIYTNQRGNILFLILVVVAMMAALFYTVAKSMRGEDTVGASENRARIYGSELIDYSNLLANGVAQLRLRGVTTNDLCFDHTSWGHTDYQHSGCDSDMNNIYHGDGGGFSWLTLNDDLRVVTTGNYWNFYANNSINQVGTTCGDASCTDLIMVADQLKPVLCRTINMMLGISKRNQEPPSVETLGDTLFKGTFEADNILISLEDMDGKNAACVFVEDKDHYAYYKVLVAR